MNEHTATSEGTGAELNWLPSPSERTAPAPVCDFPPMDPGAEADGTGKVFRPFAQTMADAPDTPVRPVHSRATASLGFPLVVLIAWGVDAAQAKFAARDGAEYALVFNYKIRESLISHGGWMREAPLVGIALANFVRRHVDYDLAWWLVPQTVIPPRFVEQARGLLGRTGGSRVAR